MTVTSLTGMAVPRGPRWPALAFFVAMAAAGPLMDGFWQSLLTIVFFYAFMGLTWNLMMSAGLLSLGHGLFLGLGAYATAVFTATGGLSPWIAILTGAASRRSPAVRSHGSAAGSPFAASNSHC